MRVRLGFVSNSSSSSFVLSTDKPLDELTVTMSFKLATVVEQTLKTKQEVDEYILEEHSYSGKSVEAILEVSGDWLKEVYQEMLQAVGDGRVVLAGSVCNDDFDNTLSTIAYDEGFGAMEGDFEIISDARG